MLKLNDLVLGYDGKPLLHMGSFSLSEKAQCLISGPSGSGKTTLLYTVGGILPAISGRILFDQTDITRLSERRRDRFRGRHIGIIFQTLHLVRSLSVLDNLMLAFYAAGLPQDKAHALSLLERLSIADKRNLLPHRLSQGQAQRVAVARAVLCKPRLILADEPTSSLDDKSCALAMELILSMAAEAGSALLVSTHDSRVKPYFEQVIQFEESV